MTRKSKKIVWSDEEDKIVAILVSRVEKPDWSKIASDLHRKYGYKKKTNRQCRERWHNHLDPNIVKDQWTREEEDLLFEQHRLVGNKWTSIARVLPGRTDNCIKNHFYSTIRKSLRRINKFLGSRDGTVKIRKIKPSTLSYVFSLQNERKSLKVQQQEEQGSSFDQYQGKEIVYHLINFSRLNLSDKKQQIKQEDMITFKGLLEAMARYNQNYEKEKNLEQKMKREHQKLKKFDKIIEKQEEEEKDFLSSSQESEISIQVLISNIQSSLKQEKHEPIKNNQVFQHNSSKKLEEDKIRLTNRISKTTSGSPDQLQNDGFLDLMPETPTLYGMNREANQQNLEKAQAVSYEDSQGLRSLFDEQFEQKSTDEQVKNFQSLPLITKMTPSLMSPRNHKQKWLSQLQEGEMNGEQQIDGIMQSMKMKIQKQNNSKGYCQFNFQQIEFTFDI